ncbi:mastermind-like protein 2 isoform X1 [Osmerus mordax]|uniref:mastermind-like protein 2 isoform X1 n=1 Tax=Osmerus mordax TaxID=8014 RepID=UPI00350FFC4E
MGEATPAQPAAGVFVPMLGVGMVGPIPGGVSGPIATSRGSAVPQLHSAIVERLRARIELCRRHHSTCENRYQRGQAETSDREHETTLHLLNIVHQGPGIRKTKGSRASSQQPLEYNRINGEQKAQSSAAGEQKISTRIALQGSLRRKIEGHAPGYSPKQNDLSGGPSGYKRARMENSGMGHGPCAFSSGQSQSLQGGSIMGNSLQRKNYMMPHGVSSDLFNMTLKEMKKEPIEVQSCGQSSSDTSMMVFDFKDEGGSQIDPELQDLFDELTKSVPSLNDLEFEKMLKHDDAFGLDLGRPSSAGAANLCSQLEKTIKTEFSPDYSQTHGGSPQLRPASAGPSFTMGSSSLSTSPITSAQKAGSQIPSRGLPSWPEVSHAEQLKQMAANQQQPNSHLHHHQQTQPGGGTSWAPAMSTHSSSSSFPNDKLSNQAASLAQQRISPQSSILSPMSSSQNKGINNCLFKSNGHNGSNHIDMKVLSKPILQFSPKSPHSVNQQIPIITGPLNKTTAQQQPSTKAQNQTHHYQNPQMSGVQCLQPKAMPQRTPLNQHGPGLHFKLAQQRQGIAPGPRLPTNDSLVGMTAQSQTQQRPPAPISQHKPPGKTPAIQRQLTQQQHIINDSDKDSTQDQFNRHLTRPPPDYKQTRNMVGVQQSGLFTGMNSSQSMAGSGPESDLQPMPCHLSNGPGAKMLPTPDRRFGSGTDPHQGSCIGQLQQHNNQNRIGVNQNKPRFPGSTNQGNAFGMSNVNSVQHPRALVGQQSQGMPGKGLGGMMTSNMGWASSSKQASVGPGLGVRRLPNSLQSQGGQLDMTAHHYQQRHVGPPNQVAPDIGMLPLNSAIRGTAPRASQPMMPPRPIMGSLNQASPEQRVPAGSFSTTGQNSSAYQSNRVNRLTFEFLQEGDNTVPGINTDSDFIDSLLKSGSGNDDWMKDINLDEILGSHT